MSNFVETSIPWVGQVPTDWDIKPLFSVATESKTKNKERNENVLSLSYGRIIRRDLSKNLGLLPENFDGYQVVDTGYIIIRSTDLQNDKKSLRVGLVKESGVITSAYIGLSPSNTIHPEYLFYYLNMCDLRKVFYSLGGGLRQSLRFEEFKRFPVIVPSIEEQKLISRYLNKKTSQIDSLVEKIQKKIELLKEQRTSLINHYVTKGLDPNVEMKDTGIEWIGEIPKHWEVSKFKYFFEFGMGQTILKEDLTDDGIPVLSATEKYTILGYYKNPRVLLKNGDLVIPARGNSIGFVKLVKEPSTSTQTTIYGRIKKQVSTVFVTFFCQGYKEHLFQFDQTAIPQITVDQVKENYLLIPPLSEQQGLCEKLNSITETNEKLRDKLNQKIILLKEYRQSVISSVVTGKVRVTEDMI